mmetsp:Transcript_4557/g.6145  ORF Transcript_4557/g.6145 Transcript_4557/m.6145 type:complete len:123 (+) Transcript_4557:248-616(+)
MRFWKEVALQFLVRASWIEELSERLAGVESDRQAVMRDTLSQLVGILMQNAHMGPGVVERMVEKEAVLVNHEINDNRRSAAELICRLQRRERFWEEAALQFPVHFMRGIRDILPWLTWHSVE